MSTASAATGHMTSLWKRLSTSTGKGACPEEDSGGIWGYEEMKQSGEIDAYDFDVEEVRENVEDLPPTGYEAW